MKFSVACNNEDMHDFKPRLAIWCQVTRADRQQVDRVWRLGGAGRVRLIPRRPCPW